MCSFSVSPPSWSQYITEQSGGQCVVFPFHRRFISKTVFHALFSGSNCNSFLSISAYYCFIFRVPPFNPTKRYSNTPIIENIRIKMLQDIFMEEVLSGEYNDKTKIPRNNLVIRLTTSAYSFSRTR